MTCLTKKRSTNKRKMLPEPSSTHMASQGQIQPRPAQNHHYLLCKLSPLKSVTMPLYCKLTTIPYPIFADTFRCTANNLVAKLRQRYPFWQAQVRTQTHSTPLQPVDQDRFYHIIKYTLTQATSASRGWTSTQGISPLATHSCAWRCFGLAYN